MIKNFTRRTCVAVLAALATSPAIAAGSQPVGAGNAKTTFFAVQGANFSLYAYKRWVERDALGSMVATYAEIQRGPGAVYMKNDKTKLNSMVNFQSKQLFRSLGAGATGEPIFGETSEVNAPNLMKANYPDGGYFIMSAPGRWREYGGGRTFTFTELSRTATRVNLLDPARAAFVALDLESNSVLFGRSPDALRPIYPITFKSATAYPTIVTPLYDEQ